MVQYLPGYRRGLVFVTLPFCALMACTSDPQTCEGVDAALLDIETTDASTTDETSASQSDADGIATGDGDDGDTGLSHDAEADLAEDVSEPDSILKQRTSLSLK